MTCIIGMKRQILISAVLYLGEIILGYMMSWSGPIIPKLQNLEESPLPYLLTETQLSLVGSVAYIGAIPGLYVIGWLSNYKGRKPCFVMCGIIAIIAFTVLSLTKNIAMLYCGRLLNACSVALINSLNILYIGEVVSTKVRGSFLAALGIFKSVGSILLFSTAPFFSYYVSAYIGVALSILYTVAVLSIPESPLFFVLKDKEDKAVNNLLKLGRMDEKDKLLDTKKEFKSTNDKMDWIELFKLRTNKKALFAVIILNTLQQCSGGMTILFFSGTIFEMAGPMINSNISMITIGCIQLIGSILSPILISRTGTKKLLLISTFVCSVTMFFMGLYFYLQHLEVSGINQAQWLPLAIFTIHFIGYECGFGILPLTLIGEMFTINVRSKGSAVVLTIAWAFGFLVSTAFGSVVKFFGVYVMFWFFSISCVCAFVFTIFCIPETKGKSLLEIQQFLGKKNRR